jgi:hypothetical protein
VSAAASHDDSRTEFNNGRLLETGQRGPFLGVQCAESAN